MGWIGIGSVVLALALSALPGSSRAEHANQAEQDTAWLINAARMAADLPPLMPDAGLERAAKAQAGRMALAGGVFHTERPALRQLGASWAALAENVGMGASVERIYASFLASSPHAANVLGNFTHLGVGICRDAGGTLFVTILFARVPSDRAARGADRGTSGEPPRPICVSPLSE